MYGPTHIPSVGDVEFTWVAGPSTSTGSANTPVSTPGAGITGSEAKGDGDGDAVMGGDESEMLQKNAGHDVDYDVAEDDAWGVE